MKKKVCIVLLFFNAIVFANNKIDYQEFQLGKEAFFNENYDKAREKFEFLLRNYSTSEIFKNNYPYFYIGENYYKLGEYEKAIYYLEKSIFSTKISFNRNSDREKVAFYAKRDYILGDCYLKIGEEEKGITYLKRINYYNYFPVSAQYEEKALEILKNYSNEEREKLELKFKKNFSLIDKFSIDFLIECGNYFFTEKKFKICEEFYSKILKEIKLEEYDKEYILENYMEVLLTQRKYKEVIEIAKENEELAPELSKYYQGVSYYKKGEYKKAIKLLKELENTLYSERIAEYIGGYYFIKKDYKKSVEYLKRIKNKNIDLKTIFCYSILQLGNKEEFLEEIETFKAGDKNLLRYLFFQQLIKLDTSDYTQRLFRICDNIIKNSKNYPLYHNRERSFLEIEEIKEVAKTRDINLLKSKLENSSFYHKKELNNLVAMTEIFEAGKFYDLALENSLKNLDKFCEYTELIKYIFPRYYSEKIKKYSEIYDIPEEIIYTIIFNTSRYNTYYLGKNGGYGIMAVRNEKNIEDRDIFEIEYNFECGCKKLKKLFDENNGDSVKTLISYIYGEDYLKELKFDGDMIKLESITTLQDSFAIQELLVSYIFYKKLYYF